MALLLLTLLHTTHVTLVIREILNETIMIHDDLEELKLLIVHNLDIYDFLDILGVSYAELVDILEEQIEDQYEELARACR